MLEVLVFWKQKRDKNAWGNDASRQSGTNYFKSSRTIDKCLKKKSRSLNRTKVFWSGNKQVRCLLRNKLLFILLIMNISSHQSQICIFRVRKQ
jgi:hypothetical protein